MPPRPPPVVAVVGATASGKTDLSLDLAERLPGEVVNTDAMQLYRGMDLGTAKLSPAERRGIPHHLLDILGVGDPANVAAFQRWARDAIGDIRSRRRTPVLVGGSALYTRAVLDRFEFPATDPVVRARWEAELDSRGAVALHAELARRDPQAAVRMSPDNGRRVVRALEVVELTGAPYSASLPTLEYADPGTIQIGVDIDRPTLDARIETRVDAMFDDGLVEEVRLLLGHGLGDGLTASRAIGYRQVVALLAGDSTEAEAREQTKAATRRFARRQDSWFRKDPRIAWVGFDDPARVEAALAAVHALEADAGLSVGGRGKTAAVTRTTYFTATTLDGFIADEHDSLDWLLAQSERDAGHPLAYAALIGRVGALVMGRTTYEWVLERLASRGETWPYDVPAWVMTHAELHEVSGADVRFGSGDVRVAHAAMVDVAAGRDVWVVGGGDLAGQLADAGLLDEVIVQVAPVTLGRGRPLLSRRLALRLEETGRNGDFAVLRYSVTGPGRWTEAPDESAVGG